MEILQILYFKNQITIILHQEKFNLWVYMSFITITSLIYDWISERINPLKFKRIDYGVEHLDGFFQVLDISDKKNKKKHFYIGQIINPVTKVLDYGKYLIYLGLSRIWYWHWFTRILQRRVWSLKVFRPLITSLFHCCIYTLTK